MSVTSPLRRIAGRGVPVHVTSRDPRTMRLSLALTSPCRPVAVRGIAALSGVLRLAEAARVAPPSLSVLDADFGIGMMDERFVDLLDVFAKRFGPLVDLAVCRPRQSIRVTEPRLLLFGEDGPVAFVKIFNDEESRAAEAAVLVALDQPGPRRAISVPRLLDQGFDGGLHWFATTPLPEGTHRPATLVPIDEVERLVAPLADLYPNADPSWAPMHGDLTPWNLRWVAGQMWLIDWEHAGFGPRGADAVWFRAANAVVRGRPAGSADRACIDFWEILVRSRLERDNDADFQRRLLTVFESMQAADGTLSGVSH